jgi:hypothetical protein
MHAMVVSDLRGTDQCLSRLGHRGARVKVGLLTLIVLEKVATPGNYLPDHYALISDRGAYYIFVPHNGLQRVASLEEARAWR